MFVKEDWIRRASTIDLYAYGKNIRLLRKSKYTFRLNQTSIDFSQVMDYISISPYVNMILDGGKIILNEGECIFQLVNTETNYSLCWVYPERTGFYSKSSIGREKINSFDDFEKLLNCFMGEN